MPFFEEELALLLAGLGRSADRGSLSAIQNGVRTRGALKENDKADGRAHEDNGRPCGEPCEHIGRGAGTEGGLRTLAAKCAGKIGRFALLQQDDANQEEAHDHVDDDHNVKQNLHFLNCFPNEPGNLYAGFAGPDARIFGAEGGTISPAPENC